MCPLEAVGEKSLGGLDLLKDNMKLATGNLALSGEPLFVLEILQNKIVIFLHQYVLFTCDWVWEQSKYLYTHEAYSRPTSDILNMLLMII